jgi:hypothetical protein
MTRRYLASRTESSIFSILPERGDGSKQRSGEALETKKPRFRRASGAEGS